MPAGLQTWTASGNLSFDSTKNTLMYIGSFKARHGGSTSFTDAKIAGRKVFISLRSLSVVKQNKSDVWATPCSFSQSGNTISWKYADFPTADNIANEVLAYCKGKVNLTRDKVTFKSYPTPTIYDATYDYGVII